MSGDYTRFTFDPRDRFAGVLMQQGRVQLDSDWNEQTDIFRERTRLLTLDSGGVAWVAWLTTPNAFLIGALAGPPANLSIGPGRLYVDGRLAEVFPGDGVTYLTQPFLPAPPPLAPGVDTLVYLDLWEREVTWAEDPDLLDVALGGVDTTTRVQQVWQVKLHEQRGVPAECGVDLNALFPPSGGRLTTSAVAPPAPDDPCILPPNAGYRGIENRLYRVEIQVGGGMGAARFKWSRDNGSIVSRVTSIAVAGGQTSVRVNRIGRDQVLRFRIGDWVTLTDDHRELNGEAGQMARIVDINEATREVLFDRAVPDAGTRAFGVADILDRNTRLQRWDQRPPANPLNPNGLMSVGAGPIDLEDGVQVSFSLVAGGQFRVGDYWVFAARTVDASVEALVTAPPRGIRHQYLQLSAIPVGGTPTDCRPPPNDQEGCCTFVVRPGENIQAAINALPPAGGCVCLKAGLHPIDEPLVIASDNVSLHGESIGAIIFNRRGTGMLIVRGGEHARIHDLVFRQGEAGSAPVISLMGADDCGIHDCRIEAMQLRLETIGIFAVSSDDVSVGAVSFIGTTVGVWFDKGCGNVAVADCTFELPPINESIPSNAAVFARSMRGFVTVEGCTILNAVNGIIIDDRPTVQPVSRARLSRVAGNRIAMVANANPTFRPYGIDVASPESMVLDNQVVHRGGTVTGIRLCGNGSSATGNTIVADTDQATAAIAIEIGHEENDTFLPVSRVAVTGNVIDGSQNGIVLTGLTGGVVNGNLLGRGGNRLAVFGIALYNSDDVIVSGNEIFRAPIGVFAVSGARNSFRDNRIDGGAIGIAVGGEEGPAISGCRVTGTDLMGIIAVGITQRCDMVENRVIQCGSAAQIAVGLGAFLVMGEWHVEANEVMDTGQPAVVGGSQAPQAWGITGDLILEARVESNVVTYSALDLRPVAGEDRALRLRGLLEYQINLAAGSFVLGFTVQIANNKFIGPGATALVELREHVLTDNVFSRFERAMFSGNYCSHFSGERSDVAATVHLLGRALTVSSNQVKATLRGFPSYNLFNRIGPFIGNVSAGPTLGRPAASQFPTPENAFNMTL